MHAPLNVKLRVSIREIPRVVSGHDRMGLNLDLLYGNKSHILVTYFILGLRISFIGNKFFTVTLH